MSEEQPQHINQRLGPPLVQVSFRDHVVAVRKDDAGRIWLWHKGDSGRGLSPVNRGVAPVFIASGEFGWLPSSELCFIGGRLPPGAVTCEGVLKNGHPMNLSVKDELWCAIVPINQTADLRFFDEDRTIVQECTVVPGVVVPQQPNLFKRIVNFFRQIPRGEHTYTGDDR